MMSLRRSDVAASVRMVGSGLVLSVTLLVGCEPAPPKVPVLPVQPRRRVVRAGTGRLLPIDFRDPHYEGAGFYAHDTVTAQGWRISCLVKDDHTRYHDLYIRWQRGAASGLYWLPAVLQMRRYFIPLFEGEDQQYLFLSHAYNSHCDALLTLAKAPPAPAQDFIDVVDYSIAAGQVAYLAYPSIPGRPLACHVVDLRKGRQRIVRFKNRCILSPPSGCIDSVQFRPNAVTIFATLVDWRDSTQKKFVQEHHAAQFR